MSISSRQYSVVSNNVSVSAVQDLVSVTAGATKILGIVSVDIGQVTATTVGNLEVTLKYLPSTVTAGSGGASATVSPLNPSDAAATATARKNDTSQATTSGTAITLWSGVWNVINNLTWQPTSAIRLPIIGLSGAFVVSLNTAPGSAMTVNCSVVFEEFP